MNEQIKELKKQAWEYAMAVHDGHIVPPLDKEVWPIDKVLDEKFAELIIKDCASLCEIESRSYTYSFTPAKARLAESTAKHCAHIIKRHFGVEE